MKNIFIALIAFAAVVILPTAVYASSRTLQPGNVYEFTGRDARVISHVTVSGVGRYDIVAWDGDGEITRFGIATGRISVSGTGGVAITPHAAMTVSFDSSRLSLNVQRGGALQQVNIPRGETVIFENSHSANMHVRTTQASNFDYVFFNRGGHSTGFAREIRLPQLSIPANGSVAITAALRDTVVYFPSRAAAQITTNRVNYPAIHTIDVWSGQVYNLHNTGTRQHTMRVEMPIEGATFAYEYITRGRDGHVTSYGERDSNTIQLNGGQSITITPILDGELYFPHAWLADLDIGYGTAAPRYQTLRVGTSLTISNTDRGRTHSVFIRCPDEYSGFTIDYTTTTAQDDVSFNSREILPGNSMTVTLQPGSTTTITLLESDGPLNISFPAIPEITSRTAQAAAITRHTLEPGQSVYISFDNNEDEYVNILPWHEVSGTTATLDYVRYYYDGEIDSYGTLRVRNNITVHGETSLHITNTYEEAITLNIPYVALQNGLALRRVTDPALFRLVVDGPVQVSNLDRNYNQSFGVLNETRRNLRSGASVLEYVRYSTGTTIDGFGERGLGEFEIPANQRIIIAPVPGGIYPTILMPYARHDRYFSFTEVADAPLYRITLRPGQRITVNNPTRYEFILRNNSERTAAGFVLGRIPANRRTQDIDALSGPIVIEARAENVIITATSGANLEIYLPRRYASRLRITR